MIWNGDDAIVRNVDTLHILSYNEEEERGGGERRGADQVL